MDNPIAISFANFDLGQNIKKIVPILVICFGGILLAIYWGMYKGLAPERAFEPFIFPYEQNFQDFELRRWLTQEGAGAWSLAGESLAQTDEETENAQIFLPHFLAEEQPYRISTQIDLSGEIQSAGINFNAQYPDIYNRHHRALVTASDGEFELSAGLVTGADGYKKQIRVPLASLQQPFRLDVLVGEELYAVQINGQTLIENRPLVYHDGLVGLSASGGPVTFDDLTLTEIEDAVFDINLLEVETLPREIAEAVVGNIIYSSNFAGGIEANGWVPFFGDWKVVDGYLTQLDPSGYDFGIGYEPSVFQAFILQVAFTHKEGIGAGLLFNMPTPYQANGAHMVRYAESGNGIFWGYYDANGSFTGQGYAKAPTSKNTTHTLKIISGDEVYTIFLDNQQVGADIPLIQTSGYIGLITSHSAAAFSLVDVSDLLNDLWATGGAIEPILTTTANVNVPTSLVPAPEENAVDWTVPLWADIPLYGPGFQSEAANAEWLPISGHWQVKEDMLVQTDLGGYDFGIGYSGEVFQNYRLDVTLTHLDRTGAGLLFNMPAPDRLPWASMVRYSDTEDKLLWGYYDEVGTFKGQGSAEVNAPGLDEHVISIVSKETRYDIWLDGDQVAADVPLARTRGYMGFVTSRSAAAFGPLTVSGLDGATALVSPAGENPNLVGNMHIISGDWTQQGSTIRQNNTDFNDYILSTGVFAGVYSLETTITLPEGPQPVEAGGGIIFHMPDQDDHANAHLVRLAGGGRGVFWGYFDEDKAFVGQGWASFAANTGKEYAEADAATRTYEIKIVVQHDVYDLSVNGELIAEGVQLINQEGFIGLLAYRGPVTFEDINLTVGNPG